MTIPYRLRIMASLHGHVVEIHRSKRIIYGKEVTRYTEHMDRAWEVWTEYSLHDASIPGGRHIPDCTHGGKRVPLPRITASMEAYHA